MRSAKEAYDLGGCTTCDPQGRPIVDPAYVTLLRELIEANPGLLGCPSPASILVVAGPARGESRASIRGFGGLSPQPERPGEGSSVPEIVIDGCARRYEICLRPSYFLCCRPLERVGLIAHELWHAGPAFDGTLNPARRHRTAPPATVTDVVRQMLRSWQEHTASASTLALVTHSGELRLSAWRNRPPTRLLPSAAGGAPRRRYDGKDLYLAILEQQ